MASSFAALAPNASVPAAPLEPRDGLSVGRRLLERIGYAGGGLGKRGDGRETPIIPRQRPVGLGLGGDVRAGAKRARRSTSPPVRMRSASPLRDWPQPRRNGAALHAAKRRAVRRAGGVAVGAAKQVVASETPVKPFECSKGCNTRFKSRARLDRHEAKCVRKEQCRLCGRAVATLDDHMRDAHGPAPAVVAITDRRESRNGVCYFVQRANGTAKWEAARTLKRARSFIASFEASFVIDVPASGAPVARVADAPMIPRLVMRRLRKKRAAAVVAGRAPVVLDLTGPDEVVLFVDDDDPPLPSAARRRKDVPGGVVVIDLTGD